MTAQAARHRAHRHYPIREHPVWLARHQAWFGVAQPDRSPVVELRCQGCILPYNGEFLRTPRHAPAASHRANVELAGAGPYLASSPYIGQRAKDGPGILPRRRGSSALGRLLNAPANCLVSVRTEERAKADEIVLLLRTRNSCDLHSSHHGEVLPGRLLMAGQPSCCGRGHHLPRVDGAQASRAADGSRHGRRSGGRTSDSGATKHSD